LPSTAYLRISTTVPAIFLAVEPPGLGLEPGVAGAAWAVVPSAANGSEGGENWPGPKLDLVTTMHE
jgi:hypothetical protein